MSGFLGPASIVLANVAGALLQRKRQIWTYVPDATIEEIHLDELVITEHPVEQGAPITDHAYSKPAEVVMKCGWSNSAAAKILGFALPGVSQNLLTTITSFGQKDYVTEQYKDLLTLQRNRIPFDVMTGKRKYTSMLMQSIQVITDGSSENALMCTIRLREIIIVTTKVVAVPPPAQQAAPQQTAATDSRGPGSVVREELPPLAGPR